MQNLIPKLRQTSIISKKPGFFVWKTENFDELQLPEILIFFAETLHTWCVGYFLFCLDLDLLLKV